MMACHPFNLVVGSRLQLEAESDDCSRTVTLLGYMEPHSVMLSWPERDGVCMALAAGEPVLIRFEAGDSLYQFQSRVLCTCTDPYPYLHVAFPEGVQSVRGRRASRVPVNDMAMMLVMEEQGQKLSVALADISMTGARLVAGIRLGEVGERFSIEIPSLNGSTGGKRLVLPCEVRYVREEMSSNAGKRVYHHGVEFAGLNHQAMAFIEEYIGNKVVEHRGAGG
ncbi:flagellar brake protein [Thiohalobacter thiocyanaticus]|uniref:Flagellar brake protein n=1 Tax=Thiohalobacter thiocyanaticus TaxID=585455 RepID=A0A426QIA7_9GAMM|nr:flagellar brake protein [Thiohalobacter thiocyanaticus]RRQ21491.1 flagellar brake protein [Thiohalobacter thiocyanaticus]